MGRAMLFLSGGMVIIFGIMRIAISDRQQILPIRTAEYYNQQQAKNIAASLIDLAIEQVRENQSWTGKMDFDDYLGAEGYVEAFDRNSASYPDSVNVGTWNEYKVLLYSEVEFESQTLTTEVLLQRDSFSKYSYFTDREPSNIYFFTGDELSGPVHTNGVMNIAGQPTFNGMVSSPNDWVGMSGRNDNNPQFLGGSNFSSDIRTPPDAYQLSQLKTSAGLGGKIYTNPIFVQFNSDASVTVTENPGEYYESSETFDLDTFNGVISSSEKVFTKGTLDGQVTLHSEKDIEILGDLVYKCNPLDNPASDDLLGIVSEKNVIVDYNAHSDIGSQDINIHASIMALDKSFSVEYYNYGGARGEINLVGGLIQEERGAVGTFSGNSVASGFSKNYNYDQRLLNMFPPSFPREKWFSVVSWRDRSD